MNTSISKGTGPTSPSPATNVAVSAVVPVHNERDNLPQLLDEFDATLRGCQYAADGYEVIFVEDGSTDGTSTWVDMAADANDTVTAIHLKRSYGQSAALAAGIDAARGDYVVPMDGDLQNDPRDIPRLIEKLERDDLDCVSGWRRNREDPWHKTVPSAIQTRLAKTLGPDINDFGCTLKVYRRDALSDVDLWGERHRYIPAQLHKHGYDIGELEVNHRPRKHGESRYGVGRLIRGFLDLLYHWFWVRYSTRPIHLFGATGLLAMLLGGAIGAISVVQRYAFGVPLEPRTPRLILVVLAITFGLQLLIFGVLAEMLTQLQYRGDTEYRVERVVE